MKTLILLRHSKAVAESKAGDHARALSPRGRREALRAGEAIKQRVVPDFALVSDSRRTRETFDQVIGAMGLDIPHRFEPGLYGADTRTLTALIADAPAEAGGLLVVGHNPGMGDLARNLAVAGDKKLRNTLAGGFPTSAFALIRLKGAEWAAVAEGGTLEQFVTMAYLDGST